MNGVSNDAVEQMDVTYRFQQQFVPDVAFTAVGDRLATTAMAAIVPE